MIRPGNPLPDVSNPSEHGQPRPEMEEAPQQPSAAERARTLVEGNPSLALAIPGLDTPDSALDALNALNALDGPLTPLRHSVGPAGDVFLLFARDAPAVRAVRAAENAAAGGADEVAAVLEITDVAPVAVPHRIRGRAWIAGWLTRVPGGAYEAGTELLRLEPGEISVDDLWGTEVVEPDEFADAVADPLAGHETEVLQHLAAVHAAEVGLLCGLVAASGGRRWTAATAPPGRPSLRSRWDSTGSGCGCASPPSRGSSTRASTSRNRWRTWRAPGAGCGRSSRRPGRAEPPPGAVRGGPAYSSWPASRFLTRSSTSK